MSVPNSVAGRPVRQTSLLIRGRHGPGVNVNREGRLPHFSWRPHRPRRDRNPGALALGLLTGVLALLAHPVSALLVGGLGGWMMVIHLKRDQLTPRSLWKQRNARWLALGVVALAGAVVAWYLPVLRSRVVAHGGGRPTEHFLYREWGF